MFFVLGARGFVGSAVCRRLAEAGETYAAITRENYAEFAGRSCDVFVNCAGNPRRFWANANPLEDFVATVDSTARSLFAFRSEHYVYISSVDVYERPDDPEETREDAAIRPELLSPYGFHKWLAETIVRRHARSWIVLRLGGLVGEGLKKNPVYDALASVPLRVTPDSELSFIDTAVVAAALHHLVGTGRWNETYNVCGAGVVRMDELARLSPVPVTFGVGGERQVYRVSNEKLAAIVPLPSSLDAVAAFFARGEGLALSRSA